MKHIKKFENSFSDLRKDSKNKDFFRNVDNIKRMMEEIQMMDPEEVDSVLSESELKGMRECEKNIREIYDFLWSD